MLSNGNSFSQGISFSSSQGVTVDVNGRPMIEPMYFRLMYPLQPQVTR